MEIELERPVTLRVALRRGARIRDERVIAALQNAGVPFHRVDEADLRPRDRARARVR